MENMAFPFAISENRVKTADYAESVRQSVQVILLTGKGERLLLPDFGTNLKKYIFEPLGATTYEIIRTEILNALYEWEDRIRDIDVVQEENENSGCLNVTVSYTITGLNVKDSVRIMVNEI